MSKLSPAQADCLAACEHGATLIDLQLLMYSRSTIASLERRGLIEAKRFRIDHLRRYEDGYALTQAGQETLHNHEWP